MAKIFHGEYYFIDANDDWDKEDLINEFFNRFNIFPKDHIIEVSKDFEWDDGLDVNQMGCPVEAYRKYFEG